MRSDARRRRSFFVWSAVAVVIVGAVVAWRILDPGFPSGNGRPADTTNLAAPDEFDRRVRNYLLEHPEVIVEALRTLQKRQNATSIDETKSIIAARRDEIFDDPGSPVGGDPNGDVAIVEFFDYNCPYCRRVAPVTEEVLRSDPNLRLVYKEWPILGPGSVYAAKAALAAVRQGKYLEFHRALMTAKGRISEAKVLEIAETVGLDTERLKADMERPEIGAIIKRNAELARVLRITGTPSFVIGEEVIAGATDAAALRARVERARRNR